jgi:hypothetical protein
VRDRAPWPYLLLGVALCAAGFALGRATAPAPEAGEATSARAAATDGEGPLLQGLPSSRSPGRSGGPAALPRAPSDAPAAPASPPDALTPEAEAALVERLLARTGAPGTVVPLLDGQPFVFGDDAGATPPEEPERVRAARQALASDPEAATRLIEDLLASADPSERAAAYGILGTARHPSHRALVQRTMDEARPDDDVRALIEALAAYKGPGWGAVQMTGPPDTPMDGDLKTAWASKSPEMGAVWIELDYPTAVTVDVVRVHETLGPGCVARILLAQRVDRDGVPGDWVEAWAGTAVPGTSPCWFEPRLEGSVHTRHVRLIVDTDRVPGWNEIDAVELVGGGLRQWAMAARAGSSYAD